MPLGPPPEAGKRRISGGEAFPPLPLPATPLRRTERKREPSPPKLIAKVVWGEDATFTYETGDKTSIADWNLCPGDLQQLMKIASARLGVTYGADSFSLASFDGDPAKTPVLFFSGVRTIKFSPHEMELLRSYVLRGGMIVADSIAGSPYFYDSFREAMEQAFPDLSFRKLPADHPIYHMLVDVDKVNYPEKSRRHRAGAGRHVCVFARRRAALQIRPRLRLGRPRSAAAETGGVLRRGFGQQNRREPHRLRGRLRAASAARRPSRNFTARWMKNVRRMNLFSRKSNTTARGTPNPAAPRGCWNSCASTRRCA